MITDARLKGSASAICLKVLRRSSSQCNNVHMKIALTVCQLFEGGLQVSYTRAFTAGVAQTRGDVESG